LRVKEVERNYRRREYMRMRVEKKKKGRDRNKEVWNRKVAAVQ
jgi:hypothetical protein